MPGGQPVVVSFSGPEATVMNVQPMHCQDPEPALWDEFADCCLEHDQAHERRVLEQLRQVHVPTHREAAGL